MKKRQTESGKSNITIIYRKLFCGNIIVTVFIDRSINIFNVDHVVKVLLLMH